MQLSAEGRAVVTTGTEVGAGDGVTTGGLPAVHPLTVNQSSGDHQENEYRTRSIPGHGFRFRREYDNYLVGLRF